MSKRCAIAKEEEILCGEVYDKNYKTPLSTAQCVATLPRKILLDMKNIAGISSVFLHVIKQDDNMMTMMTE